MAESEEELKSLLKKVNEESEKVGLNLSIQKTKIMASSPITSWQIDGETMETETLFWGASKSLYFGASLVAQMVKHLPEVRETQVLSLGWEDPPEEGMATHSQYSGLENSMDCVVHGVAKSQD